MSKVHGPKKTTVQTEPGPPQHADARRTAFVTSLESAVEEGRRDGFLTAEDVTRDVRAAIEDARARQG